MRSGGLVLALLVLFSCEPRQPEPKLSEALEKAITLADEGAALLGEDLEGAIATLEDAAHRLRTLQASADVLAGCQSNLVDGYLATQRFAEAEVVLNELLTVPALDSFSRGRAKCQLGLLCLATNRLKEAKTAFELALAESNQTGSQSLGLLVRQSFSRYWHEVRNYGEAQRLLKEAYRLSEPQDRRAIVSDLLLTASRGGDREGAERWARELKQLLESESLGALDRALANHLLAEERLAANDLSAAEVLLRTSLSALDDRDHDPLLSPVYNNFGHVLVHLGKPQEALRMLDLSRVHLGSERERYRQLHMEILENQSFAHLALQDSDKAYQCAREAYLLGHELVVDVLDTGTEDQRRQFQVDRNLIGSLAQLAADGSDDLVALLAEALFTWKGLVTESVLNERAGDRMALKIKWASIEKGLPDKGVLVDYVVFDHPDGAKGIGAIVLAKGARPRWVLLAKGEAVASLATSIERVPSDDQSGFQNRMADLHAVLWKPIQTMFPSESDHVVICPDGFLRDVPFAFLRDAQRKSLCQIYSLGSFLMASRDLLEPELRMPRSGVWAVYAAQRFGLVRHEKPSSIRKLLSGLGDLRNAEAEWLTLKERGEKKGYRVRRLERLSAVSVSPGILHVTTHGYTVPKSLSRAIPDPYCLIEEGYEASVRAIERDKPLQRHEDHFFTPAEAMNLPLNETYLATLSTCRSAEGIDVGGERISGFGRAFALAGAKNVLLTMWRIRDDEALAFMRDFYGDLVIGRSASQAIWDTQRAYAERGDAVAAAPYMVYRRFGFGAPR